MGRHSNPGPDDADEEPYDDGSYVDETYAAAPYVEEPLGEPRREDSYVDQPGGADSYRDEPPAGATDQTTQFARYRDEYDQNYGESYTDAGYRQDPRETRDVYSDEYTDTYTDDYVDDYVDDYTDEGGYDDRSTLSGSGADPVPPTTGGFGSGHRNDGELTGSHRIIAGASGGRRGVSVGVIAALVTVVVVVAGFILWRFFGDAISDRSNVAGDRCLKGDAKVAVLADPAIAEYVGQFAEKFNKTAGPIGDHCALVSVKPADSDAVVDGLVGQWPADLGDKPALWIPGSSVSAARLQAAAGAQSVSASKSLVKSPVVLAINPALKPALEQQTWGSLPGLQSDPVALDNLNLPGWGSLRLALPTIGDSDAAYLAAEAVAAASAPAGAPPTSGIGAVNTLVAGAPKLPTKTADDAMAALLAGTAPADATVHAVVTTEQQLIHRAAALPDANNVVASWLPPGPAAVADFPAVLLAGDWLAEEQLSAASEFERFMRKPDQLAELAKAGFRIDDNAPPATTGSTGAALAQTLSVGDDNVRVTLANALSAPVNGSAASIMLDRSLNLTPIIAGLEARIGTLSPSSSVGLTVFDGAAGTTLVNLGALSDDVEGRPRSEVLTSTLNGLTSAGGGGVSFTTLRNVYAEALTDFRQGQSNSVLVITSGPHTDQSLDSAGVQAMIRSSADPARPVAVNVINVGDDPDRDTWEAVAQISGGAFQNVPASDSPEMVAAINSMLD